MTLRKRLTTAFFIALFAITAIGCSSDINSAKNTTTVSQDKKVNVEAGTASLETSKGEVKMSFYVPKEDGSGVTLQSIDVEASKSSPKVALMAMLKADRSHDYPVFDKAIIIESVTVKDKVATVEVNKAFTDGKGGDLTVKLQLAAIVNTLTSFDDINSVLFISNGKKVNTIGNFDTSEPLGHMKNSIK